MSLRRKKLNGRQRRLTRGQSTVEFALVLVFLLIPLLVGLADVARIYWEQLAVVHAAEMGARWATLSPDQQANSGFCTLAGVVASDLASHIDYEAPVAEPVSLGSGLAAQVVITYHHT